MLSIIKTVSLQGLEGYIVNVEVDVTNGLPCLEIVGLPGTTIKESKERIRSAIRNAGFEMMNKRITVNLSPADLKNDGSGLDLAIAAGILISFGEVQINKFDFKKVAFCGELSLDGKIHKTKGILPICIEAKNKGIDTIIVPFDNLEETCLIDGIQVLGANNLNEVIKFVEGKGILYSKKQGWKDVIYVKEKYNIDFADVKGQQFAKRALEIAASGNHNCLLSRISWLWQNNVSKKDSYYFTRCYV